MFDYRQPMSWVTCSQCNRKISDFNPCRRTAQTEIGHVTTAALIVVPVSGGEAFPAHALQSRARRCRSALLRLPDGSDYGVNILRLL